MRFWKDRNLKQEAFRNISLKGGTGQEGGYQRVHIAPLLVALLFKVFWVFLWIPKILSLTFRSKEKLSYLFCCRFQYSICVLFLHLIFYSNNIFFCTFLFIQRKHCKYSITNTIIGTRNYSLVDIQREHQIWK